MKTLFLSTDLSHGEAADLYRLGFDQVLDLRLSQKTQRSRPIEEALFLTLRRSMVGYEQDADLSHSILSNAPVHEPTWQTMMLCLERSCQNILVLCDVPAAVAPCLHARLSAEVEVRLWSTLDAHMALAA